MMKDIINLFDDLNWIKADNYPDGTQNKILRDEKNAKTILLKLPERFKMDRHSHVTTEQHIVLKGSYTSDGATYSSGSYRIIPAHTSHGPFESKNGALILVIWDPYQPAE